MPVTIQVHPPHNLKVKNTDIPDFPLHIIHPSPLNPRRYFPEAGLEDLANSIRIFGVQQPITIRPIPASRRTSDNEYDFEIVLGERRWRAAKIAGLKRIPAIVLDISDADMVREALAENLSRADLSCIEEARGYQLALEHNPKLTHETIAKQFGKAQSHISKYIGLLSLPESVKEYLTRGDLSASHGIVLLPLSDYPELVESIARRAVKTPWSVILTAQTVADEKRRLDAADNNIALPFRQTAAPEAPVVPAHVHAEITTPSGVNATANVSPDIKPETVEALSTMVDLAHKAASNGTLGNTAAAPPASPSKMRLLPAPTVPDEERVDVSIPAGLEKWLLEQNLTIDQAFEELVRYRIGWKEKIAVAQFETTLTQVQNDVSLAEALKLAISCHLAM